MKLELNDLTPEQFLAEYWQKKPLVIRQGFKNFQDLLSADEMAGLASDELVESRRVFRKGEQWQAEFGPFECYEHLGEKDWTLIVQALNNWLPAAEDLIQCFDFIPRWRLDDVMVSFGTPGGSVGPHIDLYDVFICQGSGSRRWRVGDLGGHTEFAAHPALLHCESFEPILDVELSTGDILYLPPGYPHDGVSLEPSMSFSVGYRTASARDMLSGMADYLIDNELGAEQIADPDRVVSTKPGCVTPSDFSRIKQQLLDTLDDKLISEFSGCRLTASKCELDLPESELGFQVSDLVEAIQSKDLIRLGGLRCLYFENSYQQGTLFINGETESLSADLSDVIPVLCNDPVLTADSLGEWIESSAFLEQMVVWINKGYWYFDED